MNKITTKHIAVWLARAEELAPTDPESAFAVKTLRSLLEANQLADDIRKLMASQAALTAKICKLMASQVYSRARSIE